jgi:hypothetical protein
MLHGVVVNEIAGFEIVGGVKNEIGLAQQCLGIFRREVGDLRLHLHVRVEGCDLP